MTQYYTDFSEFSAGDTPSDMAGWTLRANSGDIDTAEVQSVSGATNGMVFVLGTSNEFPALSLDDADGSSDVEVYVRARSDGNLLVGARGSGTTGFANGATGYYTRLDDSEQIINRDGTNLGSGSSNFQTGSWHHHRLRANGTSLSSRDWQDGNSEPSSWDVETTDSTHSSGWVGAGAYFFDVTELDKIGIGTGGDTAPTSAGSVPNSPTNLQLTEQ